MNEIGSNLIDELKKEAILYALLDSSDNNIRVLCKHSQKKDIRRLLEESGWKLKKDTSKDEYLYGMNHFCYFTKNNVELTICFQIACRSTLNNEWVPLDRKINNFAMETIEEKDGITYLSAEDEICYLLAKCVYTEKKFDEKDKKRIKDCMASVEMNLLLPKLEGVFFKFSKKMIDMINENEFDNILSALMQYADY